MSKNNHLCQYSDPSGQHCCETANNSGFCFWHDKQSDKSATSVKAELERYAQSGGLMRGISLKHADLSGIDLVNHHQKSGYDLTYADLYKANLSGAHLFNINLENASLMKAEMSHANMNCANLKSANLLGVRWSETKIENVKIGKKVRQEVLAKKAERSGNRDAANDLYEQAEEIYRDLRKHAEREGIFAMSGHFIQKELTMRRMQMPKYSMKRITSKIIDLFCGYGEAPLRIVGISILMIICCAFLYTLTGLNYQGELKIYHANDSYQQTIDLFLSCLYYSVVTFTTLGYGDFAPIGLSRAIAAFEAFTGSFTIALFVVVFVKKMTR